MIRHGIAARKEDYAQDEKRPLTEKGHRKTTKVAKQLRDRQLRFDLILTSPLVRARETATILKNTGLGSQVEEFDALAPDGDIHAWVSWLEQRWPDDTQNKCLALVGHQPDLGNWAETLVWGAAQEKIVLKKAGVIGLHIPNPKSPLGQSQLVLLTSPRWII